MLISIGEPTVRERGDFARWSVPLTGGGDIPETLWFEVPTEWEHMLSDTADAAVVALVVPALRAGYDLVVDAPVTDELAFQHAELQSLYAECGNGAPRQVTFKTPVPVGPRGDDVVAGFSGGIDSYAMLGEYLFADDVPGRLRLTHLLFNNVGSHGDGAEELWHRRYRRLVPAAQQLGLPFIPVNSNVAGMPGSADFQMVNTVANAAVGHLLAGSAGTWIFSSSVEYRRVGASTRVYNSAFVDPMALPLMSTSALAMRLSRSDLRRVDKARVVADLPPAWESLDVCIEVEAHGHPNCSRCWKCRMTLAALDLVGAVDRFSAQFDLDKWRRDRDEYLAFARYTTAPALVAELRELMDDVGYEMPLKQRAKGRAKAAHSRVRTGQQLSRSVIRKAVRRSLR